MTLKLCIQLLTLLLYFTKASLQNTSITKQSIVIALMGSTNPLPGNFFGYRYLAAAVPLAIRDANRIPDLLLNYNLSYVLQPSECSSKVSSVGLFEANFTVSVAI